MTLPITKALMADFVTPANKVLRLAVRTNFKMLTSFFCDTTDIIVSKGLVGSLDEPLKL